MVQAAPTSTSTTTPAASSASWTAAGWPHAHGHIARRDAPDNYTCYVVGVHGDKDLIAPVSVSAYRLIQARHRRRQSAPRRFDDKDNGKTNHLAQPLSFSPSSLCSSSAKPAQRAIG